MKQEISGGIKADKRRLTAKVGERIAAELEAGNVQEAFLHLKGWYRAASETQLAPCPQMMERQTNERVQLYAKRVAHGEKFPQNGDPFNIGDDIPTDGELRAAVVQMSHGRCGRASGIHAEHIKAWLRGAKKEEDPETAGDNQGAGKTWREFAGLCISIWRKGKIPEQMCWVITVLIPKGGGGTGGSG